MVLYHASQKNSLKLIMPQPTRSNNMMIGDYVFATSSLLLAKMYLANKGLCVLMEPDIKAPTIVICSDAKSYKKNDKGGTIYELDNKTFIDSPQKELSSYEKVSTVPIAPIGKKTYKSSLDAMQKSGIKVYFVDEAEFNSLIKNPKQKELIKSLEAYIG